MTRALATRLANGRLHLNDGPIDLVIACDGRAVDVREAEKAAVSRFESVLDELCAELPLLRKPVGPEPHGSVARRMWNATRVFVGGQFITPMAAVAGAVAEEIVAAMTTAAPLTRAMVNNGGDIAIHLAASQGYRVGLIDNPGAPSLFATAEIRHGDPVRGIATSGWRGRSFSFGIADAVTVLASRASLADAAATLIANAVDLPGHPNITRVPACDLQPDSDLGKRLVTRNVGPLTAADVSKALDVGQDQARSFLVLGHVAACALHLRGETRTIGALQAAKALSHA